MSKAHRGKGLIGEYANRGRGTCPACKRTGIKTIYEVVQADDQKMNVCKECSKAIKNKKAS
ncbi:hypothetical protein [Entomospira culicis]|uniref:Uncharacterized protein n=1 Tax=Entomospira culicis TaxID=2719989 RepID=A0A968KUK1_9SPIO|nr:hypothetical protein [Entomospira culicis]NIZ18985.1 hypothetical protein [Entomospira culicis]NIZ69200.1 hypothetical protein [Entomospira culicis]WDI37786.1 hypothetical protein PVA46_03095 [Entomospira culicis]WDI39414.1 hypothetical protein PVA47_03100 [Entomospira culicis]